MDAIVSTEIDGLSLHACKVISDPRGDILHMLRIDSPLFSRFGEIYFSWINPGKVKAWKRHKRMTQHFCVPVGRVQFVFFDGRSSSASYGKFVRLDFGVDNYGLLRVPPLVWYGFCCQSPQPALIANCADLPHDPEEIERLEASNLEIPTQWGGHA